MKKLKITAIGGVPATGKTTLMRRVIEHYAREISFPVKEGLITALEIPRARVIILGDYSNPHEVFAGTDKLSMAVQPEFLKYVNRVLEEGRFDGIIFEGDRLFNASLFSALKVNPDIELRIIILTAAPEVLAERYKRRGSNQPETFLKGRETKVENIRKQFKTTVWDDSKGIDYYTRLIVNDAVPLPF